MNNFNISFSSSSSILEFSSFIDLTKFKRPLTSLEKKIGFIVLAILSCAALIYTGFRFLHAQKGGAKPILANLDKIEDKYNPKLCALLHAFDHLLLEEKNRRLAIQSKANEEGEYSYGTESHTAKDRVNELFSRHAPDKTAIEHLKELIGKKRLKRIFCKPELGLNPKMLKENRVFLTQEIAHKIIIGLADVRMEDLEELSLQKNKNIKDLNVDEIDQLYEELFPFPMVKEILTRHCSEVDYLDNPKTSGKGFKGLQERVWTILTARDYFLSNQGDDDLKRQIVEIETLTSRFADREPPVGTIVRVDGTYFSIDAIMCKGGAHVSVLREIGVGTRTLLLCRGTATRYSARGGYLSTLNDVTKEIGVLGITQVWPEIKRYLTENKIEEVEILGKSLGGGHASYLTVLVAGKTETSVRTLATVGGVGVSEKLQEIYNSIFLDAAKTEPEVIIIRNTGDDEKGEVDYIPGVGGPHLRSSKTKVYYLAPEGEAIQPPYIPEKNSFVRELTKLLKSFKHGHIRQNTLKPFQVYESLDIDKEANQGTKLEYLRNFAAVACNILSMGQLNKRSFEQFYSENQHG